MRAAFSLSLASLLTTLHALTITYPTAGASLDPSQPITIRWTSTSSDPSTFNLAFLSEPDSVFNFGNDGTDQIASNIRTASGSYTIPANTVSAYGSGFSISAQSTDGTLLASSGSFVLAYGAGQVVTGSDGQYSLIATPTGGVAAQTSLSSLTFDTSGLQGQSATATYLPSTAVSFTGSATHATGTLSSLHFSTEGVTGNMTIMSSTSTHRSSASSTMRTSTTSSSSSASAAATNAQVKVGVGREVMGLAGLVAGLVALVA